jgi:hypothetical protein
MLMRQTIAAWGRPGETNLDLALEYSAPPIPAQITAGDLPDGTYLLWLAQAAVDLSTTAPLCIDVGSQADELFLRTGFHEREGAGAQQIRWTYRQFSLEIPLLPGRAYRQIVLQGMLPEAIRSRGLTLRVQAYGKAPMVTEVTVPSGWTALTFNFPQPLQGDLARFDFALSAAWIPARETPGGQGDPRELGFYLDTLELR